MTVVGLVGLGYWGRNIHRVLEAMPDVRVKFLSDLSDSAVYAFPPAAPERYSTTSFNAVIQDGEVDAVLIATPAGTHAELAVAALKAGKHVFVEKPLATSVPDAERIVAEAAKARRTLMVGHTFLYDRRITEVRDVRGWPGYLYAECLRLNTAGREDVSALWDLASHDLAILRYWTNESPRSVRVRRLTFWNVDVTATYVVNAMTARIHVSYINGERVRRITLHDRQANLTPIPLEETVSPEPLAVELREFIDCCESGLEPRSSGRFGLEVVRDLAMIEAAAREQAA